MILRVIGLGSLSGSLTRRRRASRARRASDFHGEVGPSWGELVELRVASACGTGLIGSAGVARANAGFGRRWSGLIETEDFGELDSGSARSLELVEVM